MAKGDLKLIDLMPEQAIRDDLTGDLANFLVGLQVVLDTILDDADRFTDIFDIDRAPDGTDPAHGTTNFVDVLLQEYGNPFSFVDALTTLEKRKILRVLVLLYRQKGTCVGIENAIRTFLNFDSTCQVLSSSFQAWQLGKSLLGIDTFLYGDTGDLWTFELWVEGSLTIDDRAHITEIANYMKPLEARLTTINQGVIKRTLVRFDMQGVHAKDTNVKFDMVEPVSKDSLGRFDLVEP